MEENHKKHSLVEAKLWLPEGCENQSMSKNVKSTEV
jgi:hypothetical protein